MFMQRISLIARLEILIELIAFSSSSLLMLTLLQNLLTKGVSPHGSKISYTLEAWSFPSVGKVSDTSFPSKELTFAPSVAPLWTQLFIHSSTLPF